MSDLAKFDDGIRPAPVTRPFRVMVWSYWAVALAFTWAAGIVIAETLLISQLLAEGGTTVAWARFILPNFLLPYALRSAWKSVEHFSYRMSLGQESIEMRMPKGAPIRVRYDEIGELGISNHGPVWFRAKVGEREFLVPSAGLYLTKLPTHDVVRIVAARLKPAVIFRRDDPPESPVQRLFWSHLYDPPAVAMQPGRRYRYIASEDAGEYVMNSVVLIPLGGVTVNSARMIWATWGTPQVLIWVAVLLAFLLPLVPAFRRNHLIAKSLDDRFEIAPDGIWVTRGEQRWKVSDPELSPPANPIRLWSPRPVLRYGRGWNAYYFDPRLIEEDV